MEAAALNGPAKMAALVSANPIRMSAVSTMRRRGASSHACHVSSAGHDHQIADGAPKPPAAPRLTERGPGSYAAERQTRDSNRRADRGTGDRAEQHQAHRLPQRVERAIESREAAKEPGGDDSFKGRARRGGKSNQRRLTCGDGGEKSTDQNARPYFDAEQQEQRQGHARRRPHERFLSAGQGNRVAETGRRETHHGRRRDRGQT